MSLKILITGGAGFVGSHLAKSFRHKYPSAEITVFDNLRRRGSELNLIAFRELGITFVHGDIRSSEDLDSLPGDFDLFVEASAEPSVLAGLDGDPKYLLQTNLVGTINCLEFARKRTGGMVFLSTSRVYSIGPLKGISLSEGDTRFEIKSDQNLTGVSEAGIREEFPSHLFRSFYGATKLASEYLIQEYVANYRYQAVINRCGVICGPGQFGKVDQGVFTLWMANHYFQKSLKYTGFGGTGKQVRDLLHPEDLFLLVDEQKDKLSNFAGEVFNVGGGLEISTSLLELTQLCSEISGNKIEVSSDDKTNPVDIPLYISDNTRVQSCFDWLPRKSVRDMMTEIHQWIATNESSLRPIFC